MVWLMLIVFGAPATKELAIEEGLKELDAQWASLNLDTILLPLLSPLSHTHYFPMHRVYPLTLNNHPTQGYTVLSPQECRRDFPGKYCCHGND